MAGPNQVQIKLMKHGGDGVPQNLLVNQGTSLGDFLKAHGCGDLKNFSIYIEDRDGNFAEMGTEAALNRTSVENVREVSAAPIKSGGA